MNNRILGVTELNSLIKGLIDSEPLLSNICIRGEISNYKLYPSGHHYFSLKDKDSSLRCVMFKRDALSLRFKPENGMKVLAAGRISVFPRDGQYQLYCTSLTPDGIGDLHVAFEQLKKKLMLEGLFDADKKKPLPPFPMSIALITSPAGAAVRDMIRVLGKRFPIAKILVVPVRVQGAEAPEEISAALSFVNRCNAADLIITGRGGGSIEDLWAFNDESVARAIFASNIPVISAVGHEPDITISDYVADLRAATPSNAAELAVPDLTDLYDRLKSAELRLGRALSGLTERGRERLKQLSARRVLNEPSVFTADKRLLLDFTQDKLVAAMRKLLAAKTEQYRNMASVLDALSPLKVLARGYSIVHNNDGILLKDPDSIHIGDSISVKLQRGSVSCEVKEVIKNG